MKILKTVDGNLTNTRFDIALRLFVAFYMFIYGGSKLAGLQFQLGGKMISTPLKDLSGFHLTWAFFGYSYAYSCIIGVLQIAGGLLLLFNRTKLIGALILYPIMVSIVLIDFFYGIPTGALAYALTFLFCLSIILYNQRKVLAGLFLPKTGSSFEWTFKSVFVTSLIVLLFIFALGLVQLGTSFILAILSR